MGDPGRMCTSPITLFPSADAAVSSRDRGAPASPAQRLASEAVALRPGAFVRADEWSALRPEQQHLVRVVAALTSNNPPTRAVLARESAAVVHGIPVVGPYPAQTQFCLPGSTSGRRSRVSRTTAAPAGVEVVRMNGHPVTSLAQTLVDLACTRSLRSSLASLSWALRRGGAIEESLFGLIEDQRHRPGIMRALRALAHALDGDSAGDEPLRDGATHRGGAGAPRRGDGPERLSGERAEP